LPVHRRSPSRRSRSRVLTDDATRRISGRLKKNLPTNLPCLPAAACEGRKKKARQENVFRHTSTHADARGSHGAGLHIPPPARRGRSTHGPARDHAAVLLLQRVEISEASGTRSVKIKSDLTEDS
jgi:hypothetical protein